MDDLVIETSGLIKDYGDVRALRGVDLTVARGEIFGFLGPNGSGKSTTIRILLGLLRPTGGTATVLGVPVVPGDPEVRSRIGYLPGELALAGDRSGRELLGHLARLRGGRGLDRLDGLADRFDLDLDRRFNNLSKGNKQKVGVIQAFMHRPELLILDEPTSGLDPLLQREFLDLVREEAGDGVTVFMSSLWGAALAAVTTLYVSIYPVMGGEEMAQMTEGLPEAMIEAFGYDEIGTAPGYISSTVYGLLGPILLLVFGIGLGARLIAGEEQDGTLELELTGPTSRPAVYGQRLVALVVQLAALVAVVAGVAAAIVAALDLDVSYTRLVGASVGLFLLTGAFAVIAFAFGAATGRRAAALGAAAGAAVVAFMFDAIGPTIDAGWMTAVSPFSWYKDPAPLVHGPDPLGLGLLAGLVVVAGVAGHVRFRNRDLMV
ncbi:MAG: ATP-binding cassette domain-containing protein [Acidimicrobiales bacterium]